MLKFPDLILATFGHKCAARRVARRGASALAVPLFGGGRLLSSIRALGDAKGRGSKRGGVLSILRSTERTDRGFHGDRHGFLLDRAVSRSPSLVAFASLSRASAGLFLGRAWDEFPKSAAVPRVVGLSDARPSSCRLRVACEACHETGCGGLRWKERPRPGRLRFPISSAAKCSIIVRAQIHIYTDAYTT